MKKNLFYYFVRSRDFVPRHCSHRVAMMMMKNGKSLCLRQPLLV